MVGGVRLAEEVATFGIGEVQAPEAPIWPIFLVIMLRSKALIIPSLFRSAFPFQLEDFEVAPAAFWAIEKSAEFMTLSSFKSPEVRFTGWPLFKLVIVGDMVNAEAVAIWLDPFSRAVYGDPGLSPARESLAYSPEAGISILKLSTNLGLEVSVPSAIPTNNFVA